MPQNNQPRGMLPTPAAGPAAEKLLAQNQVSAGYGLALTREDALALLQEQDFQLRKTGRIALSDELLPKLVERFCDSPYLAPQEYAATLQELLGVYHAWRAELSDMVGDEELLEEMRKGYDEYEGSVEQMDGVWMYNFARRCRGLEVYSKEEDKDWAWEAMFDEHRE